MHALDVPILRTDANTDASTLPVICRSNSARQADAFRVSSPDSSRAHPAQSSPLLPPITSAALPAGRQCLPAPPASFRKEMAANCCRAAAPMHCVVRGPPCAQKAAEVCEHTSSDMHPGERPGRVSKTLSDVFCAAKALTAAVPRAYGITVLYRGSPRSLFTGSPRCLFTGKKTPGEPGHTQRPVHGTRTVPFSLTTHVHVKSGFGSNVNHTVPGTGVSRLPLVSFSLPVPCLNISYRYR